MTFPLPQYFARVTLVTRSFSYSAFLILDLKISRVSIITLYTLEHFLLLTIKPITASAVRWDTIVHFYIVF